MNKPTVTFSFDTPLKGEEDGKWIFELGSFEVYISVFHYKKITNKKYISVKKILLTWENLFSLMKMKSNSIWEEHLNDETEIT